MQPLTLIVNENDEIIWLWTREEIDTKNAWYRVSALRITNSKGEILLAQRAWTKSHNPGKRGAAVAGTNDEGETYLSNIIKETKEEIGIDINEDDIRVGEKSVRKGKHNHFTQRFYLTIDKPIEEFTIPENDVIGLRWISKEQLMFEITHAPETIIASTEPDTRKIFWLI